MKSKNLLNKKIPNGFTLIELLISMVLGLILIGGVYSVFTENARTSQLVQATSRTQENGRFALSELVTRGRMIGYMGCLAQLDVTGPDFINTLNSTGDDYYFDLTAGQLEVIDYDGGNLPIPLNGDIDPLVGTDVLVIRGLSSADYNLKGSMPNTSADLKISGNGSQISEGDVLFLSDCQKGAIFQVTNTNIQGGTGDRNVVHNTGGASVPGNASKQLSNGSPFAEDATVQQFSSTVFFIAPASFTNNQGDTVYSLWQKNGSAPEFELVSGIEDLEVWLGEDSGTDGVPDRVVRPDQLAAADARNVVTIDFRIRANSIDPVEGPDPIKRDFFASVKLRNRGI